MQGWRKSNEDAHITAIDFEPGHSLFAVFDGHGGCEVAKYCGEHFVNEIRNDQDFKDKKYEACLKKLFVKIDRMLLSDAGKKDLARIARDSNSSPTVDGSEFAYQAGCTANVVLITPTHIICGNAGDARCVVSENGKAIDMSIDHKPDLPTERTRVLTAGHFVEDGRVDGIIAISRAIGDWEYKSQNLEADKMAVSAFPEVKSYPITPDLDFFICACDGIWDCMTSQVAVDFVYTAKAKMQTYTAKSSKSPTKTGV